MATNRSAGVTSSNSLMTSGAFTGGLNTELSGIVDSADFTKDELNMMIRQDNCRSRRPGVDYEELYKFNTGIIPNSSELLAFSCIEWYDINSPDEAETYKQIPYIVVQAGSKLLFYVNKGQPYSANQATFTLNLNDYALDDDPNDENYRDPAKYRCRYAIAYGCLFITSEAIRPIRLRAAQKEKLPILTTEFPYCSVSCTAYQGHFERMGTYKDKANKKAYFRILFDNTEKLKIEVPVSNATINPLPNSYTLAAAFNALSSSDRRGITAYPNANSAGSISGKVSKDSWSPADWITFKGNSTSVRGLKITIEVYGWYSKLVIRNAGRTPYNRFPKIYTEYKDRKATYSAYMSGGSGTYQFSAGLNLTIRDTYRGAQDYLAIDDNPVKLSYAHLYNLLNQGWTAKLLADFYYKSDENVRFFPGNNLAQQYLKDEKTDEFKPEALINMTFGNTPAARGHFKLDYFKQDRNEIASLTSTMEDIVSNLVELGLSVTLNDIRDKMGMTGTESKLASKQVPIVRPKVDYVADLAAYAGRIFYLTGGTLLYSQMITEDISRSDQCLTDADPTSEELSDVIESDGGLISLPDLGEGLKLAQVGAYLLAFGTRANVAITGTANNIFTATAYSSSMLNAVPTQAPDSFVETEYGLFYWGTTSITAVLPSDGGLAVQDISTPSIMTWYGKLTNLQQKYCKGVYSSSKKKIYWFYPSDTEKSKRLDCVLVYDIQRGAFAPQKIATGAIDDETGEYEELDTPEIVSGLVLKVPFRSNKEYPIVATAGSSLYVYGYTDSSDNRYYLTHQALIKDDPVYTISGNNLVSYSTILKRYWIRNPQTNELIRRTMVFPSDTTTTYYGYSVTQEDVTSIYYTTSLTASENDPVYTVGEDGVITVSDFVVSSCSATVLTFEDSGTAVTCLRDSLNPQHDTIAPVLIWASREDSTYDTRVNPLAETGKYYEVVDDEDIKILADKPIESEEFTYESSILLCYDPVNQKVTFGDFRNNLLRDWTAGDFSGDGYLYDSYLISHPMNSSSYANFSGKRQTNLVNYKNMPYLITYFRRTEVGPTTTGSYVYPSKCQGSILWDWRTSGEQGKWSNPTDLYRPHRDTIFENGFIINKTNIRGLGRSYQIKLESVDDNQFIIEGLVYNLKNDGRV